MTMSIGKYEVIEPLGAGSYGETFRVSCDSATEYALKWRHEHIEKQEAARFENEAWALGQLDHPAIPKLIDKGEEANRPFIVMSLAPGRHLLDIVEEQKAGGGFMPEREAMWVVQQLLDALVNVHGQGIIHRDIKLANIMYDAKFGLVSLIDFGICNGKHQPVRVGTFRGVGALKYAPPSRLKSPASHDPSHDVFAVGVLAYLLLTNRFPWDFDPAKGEDESVLESRMLSQSPEAIPLINSSVERPVVEFINSLLTIKDHERPLASKAYHDAREILARARSVPSARMQYTRVVRDPIHHDILLTELEWRVVNSKEFQRLRWIRQLGASSLIYPGADHSRFSHAIGTLHVASEILRRIEETSDVYLHPEEKQIARLFALIHDVTHIPFGHSLEDELGIFARHDDNEPRIRRLLTASTSELGRTLRQQEVGQVALEAVDKSGTARKRSWLLELVESPAGADVIDYIDRDSYFCGLDHKVDSAIYRRFTIEHTPGGDEERRHLLSKLYSGRGFRLDAEFALENILLERLALFMKVFTHPAKAAVSAMLGKAVSEVLKKYRTQGKAEKLEPEVEWMGDSELLVFLRDSKNRIASELAKRILSRRIYKPFYQSRVIDPSGKPDEGLHDRGKSEIRDFGLFGLFDEKKRVKLEKQFAKSAGLKPHETLVYCMPSAPGLQKVVQYVQKAPSGLREKRSENEQYSLIQSAHMRLWKIYVFAPPDISQRSRDAIDNEGSQVFSRPNELPEKLGKQMMLKFR
jgi:uncharacterized protein